MNVYEAQAPTQEQQLQEACISLVRALNPDYLSDADMRGTPLRIRKMFQHFFRGSTEEDIEMIMSKVFPTENDQMVIVKDIKCFGLCPHHFAPIEYKVHIGYIPRGKALGLSKLARLSVALSSYPKLQENFTKEIGDALEKYLNPEGIMVVVDGIHGCMRFRGVEQHSDTITSDVRGAFKENPETRAEFMKLLELRI